MSISEATRHSIAKAVVYLRQNQDDQGRWLGMHRSTYAAFHYAAALAIDHEPPDSAVIQDLCDFVESCTTPDGAIGDYPGEPASGFQTSVFIPFLKWARPHSPALAAATDFLRRTNQHYQDPTIALSRYLFDPSLRSAVLGDKGPPELLLLAVLRASRRHISDRWSVPKMYAKAYPKQTQLQRQLEPFFMRILTFPPASRLEEAALYCAMPTGFDVFVSICASLRQLAGDASKQARQLYSFALKRRGRFIYGDEYESIGLICADLLLTETFALPLERQKAQAALRSIDYQGQGWLRGRVTPYVWETAMTVVALLKTGMAASDPMIKAAADYLREARSPVDGMWGFAYSRNMGERRIFFDTDTSGTVCLALAQAGEPPQSSIMTTAARVLESTQEPDGAFSTWGESVRPNFCWISNSSHVMQALISCGMSPGNGVMRLGARWLLSQQLPDGSWVDGWCARYIHGTVTALEALLACGKLTSTSDETKKAMRWLLQEQNEDGGWGENWVGARSASTCEHTALAVYGLCLASPAQAYPIEAIRAGAQWLIDHQHADGTWSSTYFMNLGFGVGSAEKQLTMSWALMGLGAALEVLSNLRE